MVNAYVYKSQPKDILYIIYLKSHTVATRYKGKRYKGILSIRVGFSGTATGTSNNTTIPLFYIRVEFKVLIPLYRVAPHHIKKYRTDSDYFFVYDKLNYVK